MTIKATYDELSRYAKERFGQRIAFRRVDDRTLQLTYSKLFLSKDIDLRVEAVEPAGVVLKYDSGVGLIDSIIRGAVERLSSGFPGAISFKDGSLIEVNFAAIPQMLTLMANAALKDIAFDETHAHVELTLKVPEDAQN